MELHQLRYFVSAADSGSISRAADRCRVSQPTLSQQLGRLEASVGRRLFDRLGRGVALTPAGLALLPVARRVLTELDAARSGLAEDVQAGAGRVRIGAIPTIAPYVLPGVIARLRDRFPRAGIEIHEDLTESLVDRLRSGGLDAALVSTPIEDDGVSVRVLGSEPMLLVSPTGARAAELGLDRDGRAGAGGEQGGMTLADLRARPRVALHEMHCLGQQIMGFCRLKKLGSNIACRTTQLSTLLEFVRLGLGVSIVPEMAAASDDGRDRRYERFRRGAPRREIAIATPLGRTPHAAVDAMGGAVIARLRELSEAAAARVPG